MLSYLKGLIVVAILFYAAVVHGSGALLLLGGVVLAYITLALVMMFVCRLGMRAGLQVPITLTQQGEAIRVSMEAVRKGKAYNGKVDFVICMENTSLKQKRTLRQRIKAGAGGTYSVTPVDAGNYEISLKKLRIYDLTGLLYVTKRCKDTVTFVALPDYYPVEVRLTESVKNFVGEAAVYDTLRSGDDASEVFKLREFQDGDKLKNVHWKLSAKMEELIVRENGFPKACATVLILEGEGEKGGKRGRKKNASDAFFQVAASLSFSVMDKECPHYVAWYSRYYQDVKRIRVDDEESFYEFLLYLLQDFDRESSVNCLEQYKEKYSAEQLLHHIVLGQDLVLSENDSVITRFQRDNVEKSVAEFELLL